MQQQDPPEIMSPPELSERVERARVQKIAQGKALGMDMDDDGGE